REQPRRMCLQWRRAPAARLGCATPSLVKAPHPFDCRTWADVELLGCLTSRSPAFDACYHPHANVRRICLRNSSAPRRITAASLAHLQVLGNPAILFGKNML